MTPKQVFLTKGMGRHKEKLTSFEMALRAAGIEKFNLVKVSSILPPRCKIVTKDKGVKELSPGEVVFCVMSENCTNEPCRLIGASVGLAVPREKDSYGYLSEHHSFGENEQASGDYAESLAAEMLATTLGVDVFDEDASWDEQKEYYKICGKIVRTSNVTQTAMGDKNGLWTTVIAAAVFVPEE
ncbi:arginine decarboxylase, pyruvoyl-dependent [Candidatus Poribacteria bacterium]|nr:arginine decarboxylase, pyruvoyl-dependent [Candidatus Poribacteria bacterium]